MNNFEEEFDTNNLPKQIFVEEYKRTKALCSVFKCESFHVFSSIPHLILEKQAERKTNILN